MFLGEASSVCKAEPIQNCADLIRQINETTKTCCYERAQSTIAELWGLGGLRRVPKQGQNKQNQAETQPKQCQNMANKFLGRFFKPKASQSVKIVFSGHSLGAPCPLGKLKTAESSNQGHPFHRIQKSQARSGRS